MNKLFGLLLGLTILAPLPSLADNLVVSHNSSDDSTLYVSNDIALIRITADGSDIQGSAWSTSTDSWSSASTIFTDSGSTFSTDDSDFTSITELTNGTIILSQGDDLISYSEAYGFQHFTQSSDVYKVVPHADTATLIDYCSNTSAAHTAALWSEATGVGSTFELTGSTCTQDLEYFAGSNDVLVDYYAGVAYDITNDYAVLDTIDLSGLGYTDEGDDFDAQGNNPDVAEKSNGDIVFAFEDSLYGYDYSDQTWQTMVTLGGSFSVVGDDSQGDTDYSPLQTGNNKHIFAFTANNGQTQYRIYKWNSNTGWKLKKTYSFSEAADLIRTNINKKQTALYWAFWFDGSQTIKVYRWNTTSGYTKRTSRLVDCTSDCYFTLDISKRGKVFVAGVDGTGVADTVLMAWKPSLDVWEDTTLLAADISGYTTAHVTAEGRWIVVFQNDDDSYSAIRWTPDSGWSTIADVQADGMMYYDGDSLYYVTISSSDRLRVKRYIWSLHTSTTVGSINDVASFDDDESFVQDSHLFVLYTGTDDSSNTEAIAL